MSPDQMDRAAVLTAEEVAIVTQAWAGIIKELIERRAKQVEKGYDSAHDDLHDEGQLPRAAYSYLEAVLDHPDGYGSGTTGPRPNSSWPWESHFWRDKDAREAMVEAASFLIAEIERIDRRGSIGAA